VNLIYISYYRLHTFELCHIFEVFINFLYITLVLNSGYEAYYYHMDRNKSHLAIDTKTSNKIKQPQIRKLVNYILDTVYLFSEKSVGSLLLRK